MKQIHKRKVPNWLLTPKVLRYHKSLERLQGKSQYGLALFLYIPKAFDFWVTVRDCTGPSGISIVWLFSGKVLLIKSLFHNYI